MDFFHDLADLLKGDLSAHGYSAPSVTPDESLITAYLNVLHRQIPTRQRRVLQSSEFVCPSPFQSGYAELKRKAAVGESLVSHQSRLLDEVEYNDPLLNDWGVHHLHLGTALDSDGYVARTGPLLFARVTDDCLYAIQIYAHGAWSKQQIVEILHRNWPESIERYRLKGILGLQVQYTEKEIKSLRQAGVQALIQVDQSVYAPIGGGIVSSGDSMLVIQANAQLRKMCRQLEQLTLELIQREASRGNHLLGKRFRLTRQARKAIVIEESANLKLFSVDWLINQDLQ